MLLFMYCSFVKNGIAYIVCLLSQQILGIICICYLFFFVIFLLHDILFVMLDLVLLLFHFSVSVTSAPNSRRNVSSLIKLSL